MFSDKVTALKVKISNEVGEAKQSTEFEMKDATEIERVLIVQNIFKVMGVDTDMSKIIDEYARVGKAYKSFFDDIEPIENDPSQPNRILPLKYTDKPVKKGSIAEKLGEKLKQFEPTDQPKYSRHILSKEYDNAIKRQEPDGSTTLIGAAHEEKKAETVESNIPNHYKTGMKEDTNGNKYQCRLICEGGSCGKGQTIYIPKTESSVYCKECGKTHKTRWAKRGFLQQDSRNNYFIAGKFVGEDENQKY